MVMVTLDFHGVLPIFPFTRSVTEHTPCSRKMCVYSTVLGFADNMPCNSNQGWKEVSSKRLRAGRQTSWLCFSVWNADWDTTMAAPLSSILAKLTGLRHSLYCSLLQKCAPNLFAPSGKGMAGTTWFLPFLGEHHHELWALGLCPGLSQNFSFLASLVCSHLPTLCVYMWRSLNCVCALCKETFVPL